jgi:uncharacterized membrane protein
MVVAKVMSATILEHDSLTQPSTAASRGPIIIWALVATLGLTIVGLIVGAPLARAYNHPEVAGSIYRIFSFVCHQLNDRSFHLAGYQFAVCSRCTGIYSGFAVAALIYPFARPLSRTETPARLWLLLAAMPLAVDFLLGYFSLWHNTHLSRYVTGALLGSVAVFFIMPGLMELTSFLQQRFRVKSQPGPQR